MPVPQANLTYARTLPTRYVTVRSGPALPMEQETPAFFNPEHLVCANYRCRPAPRLMDVIVGEVETTVGGRGDAECRDPKQIFCFKFGDPEGGAGLCGNPTGGGGVGPSISGVLLFLGQNFPLARCNFSLRGAVMGGGGGRLPLGGVGP